MGSKLVGLAVAIAIGIAAYTGFWFYAASQLEARAGVFLEGLTDENVTAVCANLDARGYPFRIGLFCDRVEANGVRQGLAVEAGAFRSAAQIYQPGHVVAELDGPIDVTLPDGSTVQANWALLHSSSVFDTSGLQRASLEGREVTGSAVLQQAGGVPVSYAFENGQVHVRARDGDLDAAFSLDRLALEAPEAGLELPAVDIEGDATLEGRADLLEGGEIGPEVLRGASGELRRLSVILAGGGSIEISGPFSFDDQGRLSGEFDIAFSDAARLGELAAAAFPEAEDMIRNAANMLQAMAASGEAEIKLSVDRGEARLGFVPLGTIPAI